LPNGEVITANWENDQTVGLCEVKTPGKGTKRIVFYGNLRIECLKSGLTCEDIRRLLIQLLCFGIFYGSIPLGIIYTKYFHAMMIIIIFYWGWVCMDNEATQQLRKT
jgi:hypothetical protein